MKISSPHSNLNELSDEQLNQNLRALQQRAHGEKESSELQTVRQELQVHRIELEMQNRALRETRAELEHAVQRYADLYDNLPIAYLSLSPAGEIVTANRAATDWLGSDAQPLTGRRFNAFLEPYDAGRFAAHLELSLQNSGATTIELTLRLPDGRNVAVQLSTRRASAPGTAEQFLHVAITDVSGAKRAQRALEEVNREQDTFNHSISHDLRAPLVTISNYAGIVLGDFGAAMDPQARGMVERIRVAARRMEDTLKHLQEYNTLGREEVLLQPVNVESMVTNLLIEHRAVIEERNADVLVDRPLPMVRAAPDMLRQVLDNLLDNALKFTKAGERPSLRIFAEGDERAVVLKFVDQGIGIDPQHHEQIFKVFERLHGYSRFPGSGMGLAIAKRAVERMGGKIWCQSEAGKGSCFCVQLSRALSRRE